MSNRQRLPAIPPIQRGNVEQPAASMREIIEIWKGTDGRGDSRDAVVTWRDLEESNVIALPDGRSPRGGGRVKPPSPVVRPQRPLENLQANGGWETVVLEWAGTNQLYYAYTEILAAATDNPAQAVLVGTSVAPVASHNLGTGVGRYYWVRAVSTSGDKSALNDTAGTYAETAPAVEQIMSEISGEILQSDLAQSLSDEIDTVKNQKVIKVGGNGAVAGIGLAVDPESSVQSKLFIEAERVAILPQGGDPGAEAVAPFIVDNNIVYLDEARIRQAAIKSAQVESLVADKIFASTGSIADAIIGTADITNAMIRNAAITNAKIDNAAITDAKIANAAVDTLHIAGEAITVPSFVSASNSLGIGGNFTSVLSLWVTVEEPGWVFASSSMVIGYGGGWGHVDGRLLIDGAVVSIGGGDEAWVQFALSGGHYISSAGSVHVSLEFRDIDNKASVHSRSLFAMLVKR